MRAQACLNLVTKVIATEGSSSSSLMGALAHTAKDDELIVASSAELGKLMECIDVVCETLECCSCHQNNIEPLSGNKEDQKPCFALSVVLGGAHHQRETGKQCDDSFGCKLNMPQPQSHTAETWRTVEIDASCQGLQTDKWKQATICHHGPVSCTTKNS